ncbi:hypothetical protein TNCV_4286341 [Trichonephila clavipes]|nr:hypothetical protein TNCV_4286341 [Trichonephila clavipes]
MRCAAFPFETGIHFRRKTDFFPEEDTTKSYSGFELTRLQAEEECMDVCKCIEPLGMGILKNYPLSHKSLREVGGRGREVEGLDPSLPQGVLAQNRGVLS